MTYCLGFKNGTHVVLRSARGHGFTTAQAAEEARKRLGKLGEHLIVKPIIVQESYPGKGD